MSVVVYVFVVVCWYIAQEASHVAAWCGTGVEPASLVEAAEELVRVRSEEQLLAMPSLELTDTERYTRRYTQRYTHVI